MEMIKLFCFKLPTDLLIPSYKQLISCNFVRLYIIIYLDKFVMCWIKLYVVAISMVKFIQILKILVPV